MVPFLKALLNRSNVDLGRIATIFGFSKSGQLEGWIRDILPMSYALQNLAPGLAENGPNPEYPWPYESPVHVPIHFHFFVWDQLQNTGRGRRLLEFISRAISRFEEYS